MKTSIYDDFTLTINKRETKTGTYGDPTIVTVKLVHNFLPIYYIESRPQTLGETSEKCIQNIVADIYKDVYLDSVYSKAVPPIVMENGAFKGLVYFPQWNGKEWFVRNVQGAPCRNAEEISMSVIMEDELEKPAITLADLANHMFNLNSVTTANVTEPGLTITKE